MTDDFIPIKPPSPIEWTFDETGMSTDQITARKATMAVGRMMMDKGHVTVAKVDEVILAAIQAEREACAKIAADHKGAAARARRGRPRLVTTRLAYTDIAAEERGEDIASEIIAAAIRARKD